MARRPTDTEGGPIETKLEAPFGASGVLVLQFNDINFASISGSSPDATFELLDDVDIPIITLTISPSSGRAELSAGGLTTEITKPFNELFSSKSEHSLVVYRRNGKIRAVLDFSQHPELSVETSLSPQGVTLSYDRGKGSPFQGPITATVYSSFEDFTRRSRLYRRRFPEVDKEALLRQLQKFDLAHAAGIATTLSRIRNANELFEVSTGSQVRFNTF